MKDAAIALLLAWCVLTSPAAIRTLSRHKFLKREIARVRRERDELRTMIYGERGQ